MDERIEGAPDNEGPIAFDKGWATIKSEGLEVCLRRLERDVDLRPGLHGKTGRALHANEVNKLYGLVYEMCTQATPNNWSGKLYYTVLDELREVCEQRIVRRLKSASGQKLLDELIMEWDKHQVLIRTFHAILGYLDRFYVKRLALLTLRGAAVQAFHDFVFDEVKEQVTRAFLDEVNLDRVGSVSALRLQRLRRVCDIYLAVGQGSLDDYENELEKPLVSESVAYMKKVSAHWIKENTTAEFLSKVRVQIDAEESRVRAYLHEETREKLIRACEHELISTHLNALLDKPQSGCRWLLENDEDGILQNMFQLLKRVPSGLTPMAFIFRKFLQEIGADMLADPQYQNQWENRLDRTLIFRLVGLHRKYRTLVKNRFADHSTFHRALKEAFEFFINLPLPAEEEAKTSLESNEDEKDNEEKDKEEKTKRQQRRRRPRQEEITISELLSDFLDRKLRKAPADMAPISPMLGSEGFLTPRTETDLERELALTVELFAYVNDKDVFALFYKKHLAKRLILNRSTSYDAEQVVIGKLQKLCGNPFVSNFTGMMKDLMLASALQRDFEKHDHASYDKLTFEFNVKVLTSGFWPTYRYEPIDHPPKQLVEAMNCFQAFYNTRTAHRTLSWIHALGSLTLSGNFRACSTPVQLVVTTFQGAILLLFNESNEPLTVEQMSARLGISAEVVKRQIYSLSEGKHVILTKLDPEANAPMAAPRFLINDGFFTKARRIRIPQLPLQKADDAKEERTSNLMKISEERRYAVEAAIVRIMKAHKTMAYDELSTKVVDMLKPVFIPQPATIRKRVDDLLERDYIEQDEDDKTKLLYVA